MAAVPAPAGAGGRRAGRGGRGSAVAVAGLDDLALVGAGLAAGGGGWRGRAGLCRRAVAAGHPAAPPSALTGRFCCTAAILPRSEEHTSELQSLMRISYAVFCLKKKTREQENP